VTVEEVVHTIEKVVELATKFPELSGSIVDALTLVGRREDPTPAVRRAQRLAAERFLGI